MRWQDITWLNGRHGTIRIPFGKTKAARRTLPMTPRVRQLLETRWQLAGRPQEGWIWPAPTQSGHINHDSLKKQHAKALRMAGLRPFEVYSIRHTFLTRLGESGCDVWTLARVAGHSNITISARYVHPSGDAVLRAMSHHAELSGTGDKTGDSVHSEPSDTLSLEAANPTIATA